MIVLRIQERVILFKEKKTKNAVHKRSGGRIYDEGVNTQTHLTDIRKESLKNGG